MTDRAGASTWVILLRGINVNPSTRVSMADLRALLEVLGFADAVTILQSGNVLVPSNSRPAADAIEAAIEAGTGVRSRVVVLALDEVEAIAAENPLLEISHDLSRSVITFVDGSLDPAEVTRPSEAELEPERLVVTPRAIYQWCPDGILQSKLKPAWWRQFGPTLTARNVRTVNRILAAAAGG